MRAIVSRTPGRRVPTCIEKAPSNSGRRCGKCAVVAERGCGTPEGTRLQAVVQSVSQQNAKLHACPACVLPSLGSTRALVMLPALSAGLDGPHPIIAGYLRIEFRG